MGMSQRALGEIAGIGRDIVANIEQGRKADNESALTAICAATGCDEESLRNGSGPLLNHTGTPYQRSDFQAWKKRKPPLALEGSVTNEDSARIYFDALVRSAKTDADGKESLGRFYAFLKRLEHFIDREALHLGQNRLESEILAVARQQARTYTLDARLLSSVFPNRLLPPAGQLKVTLTLCPELPANATTKILQYNVSVQDASGRTSSFSLDREERRAWHQFLHKTGLEPQERS